MEHSHNGKHTQRYGELTDWFQLPDTHKGKEILCDQKGSHYTLIDECIHEANSVQWSCREHRDSLISIRQSLSHRHYCFRDLRIGSAYNYERASETDWGLRNCSQKWISWRGIWCDCNTRDSLAKMPETTKKARMEGSPFPETIRYE